MLNYDGFRALDAILRHQSFGSAARELSITQSAVSQRLRQLEVQYGQRLLVRELPYRATGLGERLLSHLRQVQLLEQTFQQAVTERRELRPSFKICLNLDSLELWFQAVLEDPAIARSLRLDVSTDDEKFTLQHLKAGRVDLSIGSSGTAIPDHDRARLGGMSYVLVCAPEFKQRYFRSGLRRAALEETPAVVFNEKDDLHPEFLLRALRYSGRFPSTSVPSVRGFKSAIVSGFGYGVLPLVDIGAELRSGALVHLQADRVLVRELFLHHWNYQSPAMKKLIASIQRAARAIR